MGQETQVSGILFLSFQQACANLEFYVDNRTFQFLSDISPEGWYPLADYVQLLTTVAGRYANPGAVLEKVGEAMMHGWYHVGPGKDLINTSVGFLRFQTGSQGYHSMIQGPPHVVGEFRLVEVDDAAGTALVQSTTPFSRDLERGVLKGGLSVVGDIRLLSVDNACNEDQYRISFLPALPISVRVEQELAAYFSSAQSGQSTDLSAEATQELANRFQELQAKHHDAAQYWKAINTTLSRALDDNKTQQDALEQTNADLAFAKRQADVLKNAIVDLSSNAILTFDDAGRIIEYNPAAEALFGVPRDDALAGHSARDMLPDTVLAQLARDAKWSEAKRHEIQTATGTAVPVDVITRAVELDGQTLTSVYVRDLTERIAAEQEIDRQREALQQSEKMTALGSLLAGIAHELNNPLSVVSGRAIML